MIFLFMSAYASIVVLLVLLVFSEALSSLAKNFAAVECNKQQ